MAEETVLGGIVDFFGRLGFYDVLLPFLLIFTIIYAILDKTYILGKEGAYPRRNLNAIVAFVSAFLFIAAKEMVAVVNQAVANIAVLSVLGVFFLALIGLFHKDEELDFATKHNKWFMIMTSFMAIGIFVIFLHALGWDSFIIKFFTVSNSELRDGISAVIFLALMVGVIYWISAEPKPTPPAP